MPAPGRCHGTGMKNSKALCGASLAVAPLLMLLANGIDPGASDKAAQRLPQIADHPARFIAAAYLLLAGAVAFVPGLVALFGVLREGGARAGTIGTGLVLAGTIASTAFVGFGIYEYEAATAGLAPAQMARLADDVEASAVAIPLLIVFLLGVVIGGLLIAWSLWRHRLRWPASAIAAGTVLNLAADRPALSALAFALQTLGYGAVGVRLLARTGEPGTAAPRPRVGAAPAIR